MRIPKPLARRLVTATLTVERELLGGVPAERVAAAGTSGDLLYLHGGAFVAVAEVGAFLAAR